MRPRLGDSGGRKVAVMAGGMALGLAGYAAGIPMAAFGTALIGNAWALSMFSAAVLRRAAQHDFLHIGIEVVQAHVLDHLRRLRMTPHLVIRQIHAEREFERSAGWKGISGHAG